MIISLILITLSLDKIWILLGENWCWSPLGLKGLTQISTFTLNSLNEKYPFRKKMPAILQHKAFSGLPTFSFHNFHVNSAVKSVNNKSTERPNFCQPYKHCLLSSVNPSTSRVNKLKVSRKVVLTFETMDKILQYDHSNESYWAVLSCGTVYYAVQGGSSFWVCEWNPMVWPFKRKLLSSSFLWYCLLCCRLSLWIKSYGVTIQIKATEQFFHAVLFAFLHFTKWNLKTSLKCDFGHLREWKGLQPSYSWTLWTVLERLCTNPAQRYSCYQ